MGDGEAGLNSAVPCTSLASLDLDLWTSPNHVYLDNEMDEVETAVALATNKERFLLITGLDKPVDAEHAKSMTDQFGFFSVWERSFTVVFIFVICFQYESDLPCTAPRVSTVRVRTLRRKLRGAKVKIS